MSSLANRCAAGANKTNKVQNVNTVYAGKNQLQGGKPLGRNGGLTAVGKASGVVRRMPPPPSLPSLRAESQGQDPDIAIVPQGGTGWSKSAEGVATPKDTATTISTTGAVAANTESSPPSAVAAGVDLRPAWAKPPAGPPSSMVERAPAAGYPTLASAATVVQDETMTGRTWRSSGSFSEEQRELPVRFHSDASLPRVSRFQGSSDARSSLNQTLNGGGVGGGWAPLNSDRWSTSEPIPEDTHHETPAVAPVRRMDSHDYTKSNADEPHHEYRLLKRPFNPAAASSSSAAAPLQQQPARVPPSTLAELNRAIEEEDEELCMTKLSKPAARVMKRVGPTEQQTTVSAAPAAMAAAVPAEQKQKNVAAATATPSKEERRDNKKTDAAAAAVKPVYADRDSSDKESSPPLSQSAPAENVWEKRKEERASAEKERVTQAARGARGGVEAQMNHHFPSVAEAASMKVDKESTRKPGDAEFTRATLRARRGPVVNDVRALQDDGQVARPIRLQQQMQPKRGQHEEGGRSDYRGYGYEGGGQKDYADGGRNYERREQQQHYRSEEYGDREQQYNERRHQQQEPYGERKRYEQREEYGSGEVEEAGRGERRGEKRNGGAEEGGENRVAPNGNRGEAAATWRNRGAAGSGRGLQRGGGYVSQSGRGGGVPAASQKCTVSAKMEEEDIIEKKEDNDDEQRGSRRWNQEERVEGESDGQNDGERGRRCHLSNPPISRGGGARGATRGRGARAVPSRRWNDESQQQQQRPPRKMHHREREEGGEEAGAGGGKNGQNLTSATTTTARPTRGIYAPRGARRAGNVEKRPLPTTKNGDSTAADEKEGTLEEVRDSSLRLKSPVVSSEGHDEWETASESSQKEHSKSSEPQQSKNEERPASRQHEAAAAGYGSRPMIHAKREVEMRKGENFEKTRREIPTAKRAATEEREISVDRLAGLDLHDEGRVVIVDTHPSAIHLPPGAVEDFEEVLSKKQKRARAEEERVKAEEEERRKQREKERMEREIKKREKRMQVKTERDEANRARQVEAVAKKRADKEMRGGGGRREEKEQKAACVTTVWNSAQPEARAALESAEAAKKAAAAAACIAVVAAVDSSSTAAALPSPIARPRNGKAPAVQLPPSTSATAANLHDKYDFMFDEEEAARAATAASTAAAATASSKETSDDNDERVTLAPSETGSAITTDDQRRLTENVSLCKDLWSSEQQMTSTSSGVAAAAATVVVQPRSASVVPLISPHLHSTSSATGSGSLPTNVAKVKPQQQLSAATAAAAAAAETDAAEMRAASCAAEQLATAKQTVMSGGAGAGGMAMSNGMIQQMGGGGGCSGSLHLPHSSHLMGGIRSPSQVAAIQGHAAAAPAHTSAFNPGFGGFNNVFGGTSGADLNQLNGAAFAAAGKGISPPNVHAPFGSRLHGFQQRQQGFDQQQQSQQHMQQGGQQQPQLQQTPPRGVLGYSYNRGPPLKIVGNAGGWGGGGSCFDHQQQQMMHAPPTGVPPQSTTPPSHIQQHVRPVNSFGLLGAQPMQQQRPQQQQYGGAAKSAMMGQLYPGPPDSMSVPPPSIPPSLGAIGGDRHLHHQMQQHLQQPGGYGSARSGAGGVHNGMGAGGGSFSVPPPAITPAGPFSRPPPPVDTWKAGMQLQQPPQMQQQHQQGRCYGGPAPGSQMGNTNGHHRVIPPALQSMGMQQHMNQQQFGGGGGQNDSNMWMAQQQPMFGGRPMGLASRDNAMWR